MGIKLDVSVETPLSDDDRDILAGISVMVLAIANRQNLADQRQEEPEPCGSVNKGADRPPTASRRSATPVATSSARSSSRGWRTRYQRGRWTDQEPPAPRF